MQVHSGSMALCLLQKAPAVSDMQEQQLCNVPTLTLGSWSRFLPLLKPKMPWRTVVGLKPLPLRMEASALLLTVGSWSRCLPWLCTAAKSQATVGTFFAFTGSHRQTAQCYQTGLFSSAVHAQAYRRCLQTACRDPSKL